MISSENIVDSNYQAQEINIKNKVREKEREAFSHQKSELRCL